MSVKFEIDRADNGNKFLCETCTHAQIKSGRNTEKTVLCTVNNEIEKITFVVTKCSTFQGPDLLAQFAQQGQKFYKEQALYYVNGLVQETKEREFRFVDYDEFNYTRMYGCFKPVEKTKKVAQKAKKE